MSDLNAWELCTLSPESPTLFSSRASVYIFGRGVACSAIWPLGSVEFDANSFTFNAILKTYRLGLQEIDRVEFGWQGVQFVHHASEVPGLVRISGLGLSRCLQDAIHEHHLGVPIRA